MKILRLTSENIKRLVAVEIAPDPNGNIVTIAGRNGQGKSSLLDSIFWALAGAGVIQGEPIRKGADKARIRLELGEGRQVDLIAERKFRRGKSELTFTHADGSPTKLSPQAMADSLIGALSFDPLAFSRKKPREQFDELRRIANLTVDIDALDRTNEADYAKRTEINREAKRNRAAAELIPPWSPSAIVDTRAILDEIESAGATNKRTTERIEKRRAFERATSDLREKVVIVRAEADNARRRAALLDEQAASLALALASNEKMLAEANAIPELIDVSTLRKRLDEATALNKEAEAAKAQEARRKELEAAAELLEAESEQITAGMDDREAAKREAIQAAHLPVEGLGFGDGIVTYNGLPFDQAGTAERWRVCIAIAMQARPKLRVIRIDEGSLLDSEAMRILGEMAKEHDFQIWLEQVSDLPESGFVIEDGSLVPEEEMERRREEAK